jgi:hypothetical protein
MKRHGNVGEAALRQVENTARAVGEEIEGMFGKVRDRATDVGGRAAGFAKDHPAATITTLAAGVGLGLFIAYLIRR